MKAIRLRTMSAMTAAGLLTLACGGSSTTGGSTPQAGCTSLNATGAVPGEPMAASETTLDSAAGVERPATAADGEIVIGAAAPTTGDQQAIGVDEENGTELAILEANKAGGVTIAGKTYTFKVVRKDDQHDGQLAVTVAQQLKDAGAVAVVGHLNSGASIPASKIYNDAKIVQISPSATNPTLTHQGFKYVFRVVGQDVAQGKADADFLIKTLGCKKIGIVDDKTAYGQGLADYVNDAVSSAGGTVVGREHTTDKDTDFTAQLTSLKGKNPDAIFFGGIYPQAGPMAAQMKKLGLKIPLMGGDGIHSGKFIELAGDAKDGNFATDAGPDNAKNPAFADFNTKYKAQFKQDVVQYAPEAYDAANIIINAIKKAGSLDRDKIRDAVAATKDYKGVTQSYTFDSNGDILAAIFSVYKTQNGSWTYLKQVVG